MAATVPTERIYILSLGSQQGNAHVHWHVAALPPGVPYEEQQFRALMTETKGVLAMTSHEQTAFAERLRACVSQLVPIAPAAARPAGQPVVTAVTSPSTTTKLSRSGLNVHRHRKLLAVVVIVSATRDRQDDEGDERGGGDGAPLPKRTSVLMRRPYRVRLGSADDLLPSRGHAQVALDTVIVAVDGSDASLARARVGFELLQPADHVLVVSVVEASDPSLVTGTGFAGGVMTSKSSKPKMHKRRPKGAATPKRPPPSSDERPRYSCSGAVRARCCATSPKSGARARS